jgi:YD repeat-containing protein
VVQFKGEYSPYTQYPPNYGASSFGWGNIGMAEALVTSVDRGNFRHGNAQIGAPAESNYYTRSTTLTLGQQTLTIVTPNQNTDVDKHYLRPINTTQTVTDSYGSTWSYTINDNRRLTRIASPDGAIVTITYNDGKVASVTNSAGTWTYAYTTPGDYGTTTVTNPQGEQTYVKYHRTRGYVTEARDALYRWTYYTYDAGYRLQRITYPEGNYVEYTYDARGNVLTRVSTPKPLVGGPVLTERAGFDATCDDPVVCNKPRWIENARGARTDFDYTPSSTGSISRWGSGTMSPIRVGTGKPITVTSPAVGGVRPQVRTIYSGGMPTSSSICRSQASCAGTSDEVVTTYEWGGSEAFARTLFGKVVSSAGQSLRTCYGYDSNGRRISETPPLAGLTSCPTTVTAAPAVTATMPSPGAYAVAPTFPDGSVGTGGDLGGGGTDPRDPPCGQGTGVVCQ